MSLEALERYQVLVYLAAIATGLFCGTVFAWGESLSLVLWPLLALLLYSTFTQVDLGRLDEAFVDRRFLAAAVTGNFVLIPVVVLGLLAWLPDEPAIRLGVAMVLLVPCTDWFITFTRLGGGDTRRAMAFAPLSLLCQIPLLPAYIGLFFGGRFAVELAVGELLTAFVGLILVPLLLAWLTQRRTLPAHPDWPGRLAWLPVPLLGLVVFAVAASQVSSVLGAGALLGRLLLAFAVFLMLAALLARVLARLWRLPVAQGRTLAFSFGSRNSFMVLPLALALPPSFEIAAVVIVFQSLVELVGMALYLWWVPGRLFVGGDAKTRGRR